MATDTTEPEAPPTPSSNRFFGWMRATGVVRQPGWIGGVCAGIADRLGIDPLIVRGIAVVVAVLGGPAILLYAAAWLLLPDRFDRIHLEQLFRGRVDAPIAAIGALVILSLLPVTQGFWSAGAAFWHGGATLGRVIWTVILLAAIVGVIVWVARRNNPTATPSAFEATDAAASTSSQAPNPAEPSATDIGVGAAATPAPTLPLSTAPPRPGADATSEDFAAWREQQAAWKAERAQFQAQQAASLRETNLARAKERREAAVARNLEYRERHARWEKANPRLSAGAVGTTIGAAIILAAIAGLAASTQPDWSGFEVAAGFGVASIVLGIVIVISAALGRRNGFMVFVSVVAILGTLVAAALPNNRELVGTSFGTAKTGTFTQLVGQTSIDTGGTDTGVVDLWQGSGSTRITVAKGRTVRVELLTHTRALFLQRAVAAGYVEQPGDVGISQNEKGDTYAVVEQPTFERDGIAFTYEQTFGPSAVADETIRIWQGSGSVEIDDENEKAVTK